MYHYYYYYYFARGKKYSKNPYYYRRVCLTIRHRSINHLFVHNFPRIELGKLDCLPVVPRTAASTWK